MGKNNFGGISAKYRKATEDTQLVHKALTWFKAFTLHLSYHYENTLAHVHHDLNSVDKFVALLNENKKVADSINELQDSLGNLKIFDKKTNTSTDADDYSAIKAFADAFKGEALEGVTVNDGELLSSMNGKYGLQDSFQQAYSAVIADVNLKSKLLDVCYHTMPNHTDLCDMDLEVFDAFLNSNLLADPVLSS